MKLNGRFFPYEQDREENNPERDFPIKEKVRDFSGKEREFTITYHDVGLGFVVHADEKVKGAGGYFFRAFDSNTPYRALGKIRDKIRKALSTRHLLKEQGRYYPAHDTLKGRLTCMDGKLFFVVDGIPLTLQQFGKMAEMHEGWEFSFRFVDSTEDD